MCSAVPTALTEAGVSQLATTNRPEAEKLLQAGAATLRADVMPIRVGTSCWSYPLARTVLSYRTWIARLAHVLHKPLRDG